MTTTTETTIPRARHSEAVSSPGLTLAAGRILLALLFLLSGLTKLGAIGLTQGYMQAMGVPAALIWPTIAFEITAPLLLIVGYRTRPVALLLAAFSVVTGVIFHHAFGDQIQTIMFLKNLAIAGGLLVLAEAGPGRLSVARA